MEILRFIVIGLAIIAGLNVLRNPIRVWPNTLAGFSYFVGAAASIYLKVWWPLLAGWLGSLAFQCLCTVLIAKGEFSEKTNSARAAKGLPQLGQDGTEMPAGLHGRSAHSGMTSRFDTRAQQSSTLVPGEGLLPGGAYIVKPLNEAQTGWMSGKSLQEWFELGRIDRSTQVFPDHTRQWVSLADILGLEHTPNKNPTPTIENEANSEADSYGVIQVRPAKTPPNGEMTTAGSGQRETAETHAP